MPVRSCLEFFVSAENPGIFEWVVPIGDVNLDDVGFDEEIACRSSAGAADLRALLTDRPADY